MKRIFAWYAATTIISVTAFPVCVGHVETEAQEIARLANRGRAAGDLSVARFAASWQKSRRETAPK